MMRVSLRPYYLLGLLIAACLVVTAGVGLAVRDLYRPFFREALLPGLLVQDTVSLVVAPALLAAMHFARRGSARALVIWAALLVYVVYYYAFYVFGFAYTIVYPLYLALVGMATFSLIGLLTGVDLEAFARHAGDRMPVRFLAIVLGMPLLFVPIWLSAIAQNIGAQQPSGADLVFVLDLCFLIPAATLSAVQLWRRRPAGYLLAGVLLAKSAISGVLLTLGSVRQMQLGYTVAVEELVMYVFLAIVGSAAMLLYLRNLEDQPATATRPRTVRLPAPRHN